MNIIDRLQFMKLPKGEVFLKYTPQYFTTGICVKGDSIRDNDGKFIDFFYRELEHTTLNQQDRLFDVVEKAKTEGGVQIDLADLDNECRDGCFDEDELYAVLSVEEVHNLAELFRQLWADKVKANAG